MAARRAPAIRIKRAYEPPAPEDGTRILVDRLWPRGVSKAALALDGWVKEIAPSDALRRWFGHDPARWEDFRRHYAQELTKQPALLDKLRDAARQGPLTLVYGAQDEAHNNAVVLRDVLSRAERATRATRAKKAKAPAKRRALVPGASARKARSG